ncbi:MAG TPA: class I SAM-dependent methyltransferase [Gemmataceae bacterium]|nr:class I SAM-dependent methyltransferase [Gemmataceae bacterium]
MPEPLIRNISDTARWAALYRARESERPDARFRDPLARRLAGERGEQIACSMAFTEKHAWTWTTRTVLYDQFITEQIQRGADMVVNLAAGLDARPYRMSLPPTLQWIEVDLPGILDYKEEVLQGEKPVCALERLRLDLANVEARRELFAKLGQRPKKALVVTEGLLIYLSAEEVGALARDLAAVSGFHGWVIDIASPGLLEMMQKQLGSQLDQAGAPFKFGPPEGPEFFTAFGWKPVDVRGMLKTAAKLRRLSLFMRLLALLPESKGKQGKRPWSAICLLEKR